MLFYIAAGILLALKLAGLTAISWWIIALVATAPLLLILVIFLFGLLVAGLALLGIAVGEGVGKSRRRFR